MFEEDVAEAVLPDPPNEGTDTQPLDPELDAEFAVEVEPPEAPDAEENVNPPAEAEAEA